MRGGNGRNRLNIRRRNKRFWFVVLGVFIGVFLFSFLVLRFKSNEEVMAASLANFDPGYIISDFQMGNYNSMSEMEIQNFLTTKNPCSNTDYNYYLSLSANRNYTWHFENGHFVCLSEERFGDGEVIGSGDTAAHIIWQTAQDYRINPQVLLVLLQKETGLITDPIPNDGDYRKATGYGCPDTAPCSEQYYGFKNQVRKAAALFRTVLDGGWTNYPLGNNYVQYNPNANCGGSVINIRSLATSALYRYTPYQPNAGALAAGYGTAYCGAYGNRNFYLYFEDWFGGITKEKWENMVVPRIMKVESATLKIDPFLGQVYGEQWAKKGYKYYFTSKTSVFWGGEKTTCLRTAEDTRKGINRCIIIDRMQETDEALYDEISHNAVLLSLKNDTFKIDLKTGEISQWLKKQDYYSIQFAVKVKFNGEEYYRTTYDVINNIERFVPARDLEELLFSSFMQPRNLTTREDARFIDLSDGRNCKSVRKGYTSYYTTKIDWHNKTYYRTESDTEKGNYCVMLASEVEEYTGLVKNNITLNDFQDFMIPRKLRIREDSYLTDIRDGSSCEDYNRKGTIKKYLTKIDVGGKTFYRDDEKTNENSYCVIDSAIIQEL